MENIVITDVEPLQDYNVIAKFKNGKRKIYDIKKLFNKYEAFKALKLTPNLFEQVYVDIGGCGLVWNDNLDLASEEVYSNGVDI